MNSSRWESFLPSSVQMAPPGTVLGHGQDDGHITVGVRLRRNPPADVAGPVQSPGLHGGTVRNSDTALHHPLVAVDNSSSDSRSRYRGWPTPSAAHRAAILPNCRRNVGSLSSLWCSSRAGKRVGYGLSEFGY